MISERTITIRPRGGRLSYRDADELARRALDGGKCRNILIDLEQTTDTTPAALARLVSLRGRLLKIGGDLHIFGLRGRAKDVYDICRLGELLPQR
ncbi:MAG: STAS domain-containing protein [Planctomycetota bacterium]